MGIAETTGSFIKSKRCEKKYSQEYLGYRLKISQNAYSKIELGITKVSFERLIEISGILEFTVLELTNLLNEMIENEQFPNQCA